jgi:hypothetical protein
MDGALCSPSFFRDFDFAPSENVCPEKVTRGIGACAHLTFVQANLALINTLL